MDLERPMTASKFSHTPSTNGHSMLFQKSKEQDRLPITRVIIINANQNLGHALATNYLAKGCEVIATHHPTDECRALQDYQTSCARLSLKKLDFTTGTQDFIDNISIKKNDLIIYLSIASDTQKLFFEEIALTSVWFNALVKINVCWVSISTSINIKTKPIVSLAGKDQWTDLEQIHVQNLDACLKQAWHDKHKHSPEIRPCAISIYIEPQHAQKINAMPNVEDVVENMIINCIDQARQSKSSGVYHLDGTREKTEQDYINEAAAIPQERRAHYSLFSRTQSEHISEDPASRPQPTRRKST